MQDLIVFQSLWAMENRHPAQPEKTLEENLARIAAADFDGISSDWRSPDLVPRMSRFLEAEGLQAEGQCFPATVDELKPALEMASKYPVHHLTIQPNVRPRRFSESVRLVDGWRRLGEQVPFPLMIETHRDRLTNDLYETLDLIECFPDLKLLADLSHFMVSREFFHPLTEENQRYIEAILRNSWGFHGRVASPEQVQVEMRFPQHRPWLELFSDWWQYGFADWRARAGADATLPFICELGPRPYAITGAGGLELTDRWSDALWLKAEARRLWDATA